ncbi:hypothetical protein D0T49_10110 [Paludibacter sp. 221]|uniref:alpha-galactosidase D n=1 Tax=Paludibacter sp. 221 TaxID=2302939 RepID=UPI0013D2B671|nr:alpha-galactosidase [Paludibacter sp. 221]NDV47399.1 hypothetical protein [Paludibacter sp. 221]
MKKKLLLFTFVGFASMLFAQNPNTPMMGWSSWNTFRIDINESLIKETADAMVSKGLKDAGYTFINVDDGFFGGRGTDGKLIVHPTRFPDGMRVVSDYIHDKGLMAGIYSEAGKNTCGSQYDSDINGIDAGFYGYEEQDAKMYFDDWNYDFIKVDYCGASVQGLDEKTQYTKIWNAIKNTDKVKNGGSVRWNICRWMFPGTWALDVAGSWRISHDILNDFDTDRGVRGVLEHNLYLSAYAAPGHFNDMDMMQIGRNTMTVEEEKSHFGLWCIMKSPLLIGCDLRTIPQRTLDVITNPEVIALNQDALGLQAQVVKRNGKRIVLAKQIEQDQGKIRAVALFNGESTAATMRITFKDVQLGGKVKVRDLWAKQDIGEYENYYEVNVPAHGTAMLRLEGATTIEQIKYEGEDAFMNLFKADDLQKPNDARFEKLAGASGGYVMTKLGNSADNWAEFRRVYSKDGGAYKLKVYYYSNTNRSLTVTVNGTEYKLNDLNSGSARGVVYQDIELNAGYNVIRLGNPTGWAPDIDKIHVLDPNVAEEDEEYEPDTEIINNYRFPMISSEDNSNEIWYYIQFKNPSAGPRGVLVDKGDNENIETEAKMFYKDEQLWKITGTADNYTIVNKNGRKLNFANQRFQASSTNSVKLKILATQNSEHSPGWEVQREGSDLSINQDGGAGLGKEIAEFRAGDQGNVLLFIASAAEVNLMPEISTNDNEVWYYIKFKKGENVLQDMGAGQDLRVQEAKEGKDEQLWKVTGTKDNYVITNKSGRVITYSESFYKATKGAGEQLFKLVFTANQDWAPAWELQRNGVTDKCLNQYQSSNAGQPLSEWNLGDGNNMLNFFLPSEMGFNDPIEGFPVISTDSNEKWYYIQFKNGNGVLQDMGDNADLMTKSIATAGSQYWKVVEVSNTEPFIYQIVNKSGRRISHAASSETADGFFQTTATASKAVNINIVKSTNTKYSPALELHREGSNRHMNQYKTAGVNGKISEWNKNDDGNPLVFVPIDDAQIIRAEMPEISSEDQSREIWYYIRFIDSQANTKAMLEDMGDDTPVMTKDSVPGKSEQLWKVTELATPNGDYKYQIIAKSGRKIAWDNTASRYKVSSTSTVNLKFNELAPHWGIEREGGVAGHGMTQMGVGPDQEIKDDYYSAIGNGKLVFVKQDLGTSVRNPFAENGATLIVKDKMLIVRGVNVKSVSVYTITGQMIDTKLSDFNFSLQAVGCYLVSIRYNDNSVETKKIVAN